MSVPGGLITIGDGRLVRAANGLEFGFMSSLSLFLLTAGDARVVDGPCWLAVGCGVLLPGSCVATGGRRCSTTLLSITCHS